MYAASHVSRRIRAAISESDYTVMDLGFSTPCWVFRGVATGHYGNIRVAGRQTSAHRAMYEQAIGPIPDGLVIDHLCHRPRCINPAHLEAVTNEENVRRGAATGRKMSLAKAREIRASQATGASLARLYGVSESTISMIRLNKIWREELHSNLPVH